MSAVAQVVLLIVGVYTFVVGLLVLGSRGMVDAVIQHPNTPPELPSEAADAPAGATVVNLRPETWSPAPAQAQAS